MSSTFSINIGQSTESTRKENIFSILQDLPNNTSKLISPRDVRDAFLSTWANSSFKVTTPGTFSTDRYIGIDSVNPSDRDIKSKILIGKRQYGNLDIMSNNLLTSNTDIFFYNTKPDTSTQSSTRIAILAGTNSNLHLYSPYIESSLNSSDTGMNLDIVNPSLFDGPINVYSSNGRVAINGIVFPTVAETAASASTGKILKYTGTYPNGYLRWSDTNITIASIGSVGTPTNIYGSNVYVNGQSIEFIENSLVPIKVGDIQVNDSFATGSFYNGSSYQNWPLSEVLRKVLYPYVPPVLNISGVNLTTGTTYAEVGTTPSIVLTYSITHYAREASEYISDFVITTSLSSVVGTTYSGGLSFSGAPGSSFNGTSSTLTYSIVPSYVVNYTAAASNNGQYAVSYPYGFSYSATASFEFVSPIVASFIPNSVLSFNLLTPPPNDPLGSMLIGSTVSVNKRIVPYPGLSQSLFIGATGLGYLYFLIPSTPTYNYGILSQIKDSNGFIVHDSSFLTFSAFTYSSSILPSIPYDYYGNYRIYRTIATCSYYGSGSFELIF